MIRCESGTDSIVWMREVLYIQNMVSDESPVWRLSVMDAISKRKPRSYLRGFLLCFEQIHRRLGESIRWPDTAINELMFKVGRCSYGKI